MLHGKCLHKSIRLVTFTIVKILVYTNHSNETAIFTQSNRTEQDRTISLSTIMMTIQTLTKGTIVEEQQWNRNQITNRANKVDDTIRYKSL